MTMFRQERVSQIVVGSGTTRLRGDCLPIPVDGLLRRAKVLVEIAHVVQGIRMAWLNPEGMQKDLERFFTSPLFVQKHGQIRQCIRVFRADDQSFPVR